MTDMDGEWNVQPKVAHCPSCNAPNNAWSSTDGGMVEKPSVGALSLCFECGALCVYVGEHELRSATPEEELEYGQDPLVIRARKVLSYTESPRLAASLLTLDA